MEYSRIVFLNISNFGANPFCVYIYHSGRWRIFNSFVPSHFVVFYFIFLFLFLFWTNQFQNLLHQRFSLLDLSKAWGFIIIANLLNTYFKLLTFCLINYKLQKYKLKSIYKPKNPVSNFLAKNDLNSCDFDGPHFFKIFKFLIKNNN